jgi:hypothetical protein
MPLKIVEPAPNATYSITAEPKWENMVCRTDASGPHRWDWSIGWRNFTKSGTATTPNGAWDFGRDLENYGGTLQVRVSAGANVATLTCTIVGTNPSPIQIAGYLARQPNSSGMDRLITHESRNRQFDRKGEPLHSFDGGYGLCQITNPAPTIEQIWNWKLHIDGGLSILASKRTTAIHRLSARGRSYTLDQLKYETVSLWNGGVYHEWDDAAGMWVRPKTVVCDPNSNIGWDTTRRENRDKSLAQLQARDHGSFRRGHTAQDPWAYSGVCYADHVLG